MSSKRREQRSLFGELIDWLLAPLLLLWPMSVALTWVVAQGIANRPFDGTLGDRAQALAKLVVVEERAAALRVRLALRPESAELLRSDATDDVYFQVLGLRGEYLGGDRELPVPPPQAPASTQEVRFRDDTIGNVPVRVAYLSVAAADDDGSRSLVQVAETLNKRSQLATEIIKGVIVPQFIILPLAVVLIWLALARGIAPLDQLQRRIRSRESHDLSPIDERDAPEEVAPLVAAINDLLGRLDRSIAAQKHFLADAAHQLKTPLAGLRTQAELAQREIDAGGADPQTVKRSLQQIARGSQRAAHMVNQLLSMARAEDPESAKRPIEVNLARLAVETVHDFVPRAMDKRIDLGYEGPDAATAGLRVLGQPLLLREMIRNLVDNALQYTPAGGTVTARVLEDPFGQVTVLQVEDNGPGIAPAERDLVLRPFYRALGTEVDGSGLGLAIVHEIAAQHEAEIGIDDTRPRSALASDAAAPAGGPGARLTVRFPARPAAPPEPPVAAPPISGPQ
jgi:two-component system sensor histidine kinase TctE